MSPQAPAAAADAQVTSHHTAVLDAFIQPGLSPAQQMSEALQARAEAAARAAKQDTGVPSTYTVQAGDSLSSIAGHLYHNASSWPVLYWDNRGQVQWADIIRIGQVLRVPAEPARIPAPPVQLGPPPPPAVHTTAVYRPRHSSPAAAPAPQPAQVQAPPPAPPPASTSSGGWPGGAFGNCVVERESGGNPDVWNASGHWGLYQFSASTWAAYGGPPSEFGNASVAEQEQVFMNAMAQGGEDNWAPYDGC